MKCSSCGNGMMEAEKKVDKSKRNRKEEYYFFCPYCFTYSIVNKKVNKKIKIGR